MDTVSLPTYESGNRSEASHDVISSFIADWVHIKYFYSEAAGLARELCETLLASHAIRAIVTHRVKQGHRLEAKLRERVRKLGRDYRSSSEIREDVVDLAGVRIALYFPSDREKIEKIIHEAFTVVKHKSFPEQDNTRFSDTTSVATETSLDFQQRFNGYSADHYRVQMRVENLATKKIRDDFGKTNPVIEIQVASVLMHAWAEIDHDLVYKTLTSGPASQQELRLLDATNGLVHTGEVLLQQLQIAMDTRVAYQNKPFSEQYELLSFLRGQIKKAKGSMDHLDILLLVLKITGLDSPRRLGEKLEGFVIPPKSTAPVALTILEYILRSLGEEQRRTNNLYLRSKSVVISDLEAHKANSKFYTTDLETKEKILDQRDILELAVQLADIMYFPAKSILVVEGMPQKFRKFYALYNLVHFATILPSNGSQNDEKWLVEMKLKEMDPLWNWFETNNDVLFRVSLQLARLNVEDIAGELIKLRPSSSFQRLPTMYEASPVHVRWSTEDDDHDPEPLPTPASGRRLSREYYGDEPSAASTPESGRMSGGDGCIDEPSTKSMPEATGRGRMGTTRYMPERKRSQRGAPFDPPSTYSVPDKRSSQRGVGFDPPSTYSMPERGLLEESPPVHAPTSMRPEREYYVRDHASASTPGGPESRRQSVREDSKKRADQALRMRFNSEITPGVTRRHRKSYYLAPAYGAQPYLSAHSTPGGFYARYPQPPQRYTNGAPISPFGDTT